MSEEYQLADEKPEKKTEASGMRTYSCPWCGRAGDAASTSCPACGAPVDVRQAITHSGWVKLPAIRDMARIQFGQSVCQIEGKYVPVADVNLAADDGVYFAHHLLLWKDEHAQITTMPLANGWKRLFAGLPIVMTQASGPGRIAFSKDKPGELIAIPLDSGKSIDVREHVFMVATHSVAYEWYKSGIWFQTGNGKDQEMNYPIGMFIDRFTAGASHGLLLLHGAGNVFVRDLAAGEAIMIKPTSLLFKDPTVRMHLHIEVPANTGVSSWRAWSQRYIWLRLQGPGRIAVQSDFEPMEDAGATLLSTEPMATTHRW